MSSAGGRGGSSHGGGEGTKQSGGESSVSDCQDLGSSRRITSERRRGREGMFLQQGCLHHDIPTGPRINGVA